MAKKTDTHLIDALEHYLAREGALLLHNDGYDQAKNCAGLGLRCTGRTLRQALEQCLREESLNDSTGTY